VNSTPSKAVKKSSSVGRRNASVPPSVHHRFPRAGIPILLDLPREGDIDGHRGTEDARETLHFAGGNERAELQRRREQPRAMDSERPCHLHRARMSPGSAGSRRQQSGAAQERKHDRRLESIHVLRRDRADDDTVGRQRTQRVTERTALAREARATTCGDAKARRWIPTYEGTQPRDPAAIREAARLRLRPGKSTRAMDKPQSRAMRSASGVSQRA
jgi:hypothetical protein